MATANLPSNLDWQLEPPRCLSPRRTDRPGGVQCIHYIPSHDHHLHMDHCEILQLKRGENRNLSNESKQQYSENNMTKYIFKNCFTWKRCRNPICTAHDRKDISLVLWLGIQRFDYLVVFQFISNSWKDFKANHCHEGGLDVCQWHPNCRKILWAVGANFSKNYQWFEKLHQTLKRLFYEITTYLRPPLSGWESDDTLFMVCDRLSSIWFSFTLMPSLMEPYTRAAPFSLDYSYPRILQEERALETRPNVWHCCTTVSWVSRVRKFSTPC